MNAPRCHALMGGIDKDGYTEGSQMRFDGFDDVVCEGFLILEPARVDLYDPGQFGNPDHLLPRNIGYAGLA